MVSFNQSNAIWLKMNLDRNLTGWGVHSSDESPQLREYEKSGDVRSQFLVEQGMAQKPFSILLGAFS